jgi:hypothetical protein
MIKKNSGRFIKCVEDGVLYENVCLEGFPKNINLLKMTRKHKKNNNSTPPNINSNFFSNLSEINSEKSEVSRNNNKSFIEGLSECSDFVRKKTICRRHSKPLDIVCLDHRCRICSNCALFGEHKNHEIINEDEIYTEIFQNAEQLFESYQRLNRQICEFENKVFTQFIKESLNHIINLSNSKLLYWKEKISEYCINLKFKVDKFQSKFNNKIEQKFDELVRECKQGSSFSKEIKESLEDWTTK